MTTFQNKQFEEEYIVRKLANTLPKHDTRHFDTLKVVLDRQLMGREITQSQCEELIRMIRAKTRLSDELTEQAFIDLLKNETQKNE